MYSTRGNYRHIMQKIDNLSWKILLYNNPNDNLIRSDFEELKGNPEPESMDCKCYISMMHSVKMNRLQISTYDLPILTQLYEIFQTQKEGGIN